MSCSSAVSVHGALAAAGHRVIAVGIDRSGDWYLAETSYKPFRAAGRPVSGLDELAGSLSPAGHAVLMASYAELSRIIVFRSSHLVLTAHGWVESHGARPRATIELLVVPLPERLAVLRRRM